uniref:Uncharacterized protein n=1 Tax=Noctiluca scintillans TaxID=2966 RepID=A0A7S0ZS36_NOCSC|mmetsp:Transcript_16651/g.45059  ORF Transcript_16651/g.45059 Transcript_16651/m.45059 type:complete len:112 (+) Transcript_16651:52-387(+)
MSRLSLSSVDAWSISNEDFRGACESLLEDEQALAVGVGILRLCEINAEHGTFEAHFVLRLSYLEPGLVDREELDSTCNWPSWEQDCGDDHGDSSQSDCVDWTARSAIGKKL